MRTRSSSNLVGETSTNPKRRNRRRSKQRIEPFSLEETPVVTMVDQRTMAELLQAPTEGYRDAIVIPAILAEDFELKHGLLNLVISKQFYGFEKEDPHAHIRWFNKIASTIKYRDAWDRFKDLLCACPHNNFTELHQHDTFYNALTPTDQDSLNAAASGNLLTKTPRDALTIIENKSKVRNSRNKPVVTKVSTNAPSSSTPHFPEIAALADAIKAMLLQKSSPPTSVKAVEEIYVTCGGPHPYHQCLATDGNIFLEYQDNIQGYVLAVTVNYNQGNTGYRPQSVANQIRPPGFAQLNVQNNQTRKLHFDLSFVDALLHMPKFATMLKSLLNNKEKLFDLATTPLVDRSTTSPSGIAEDVFVKVGKFHFPADFVVVDYVVDPRVPLILGRPFLKSARALIDVYGEELTLRVDDEAITIKVGQTSRYSYNDAVSINRIDVIDVACEEYAQEVLEFSDNSMSGNPTPSIDLIISTSSPSLTPFEEGDFILEEIKACITNDSILPGIDNDNFNPEGELLLLENLWVSPVHCVPKKGGITVIENDDNELIPTRLVTGLRVCIDYRKLNDVTRKDHFSLPFMDQMLERLAGNKYYCFLDGFSGYFQIPIDPQDQEKTTFTCPYGTFTYRRMPFGLCNASGMFQRDSFSSCLSHLDKMLKRCEDTNLVLNWKKCDFMVKEGIVLGHKISKFGIEVDKAKIDVIAKLPHPTSLVECLALADLGASINLMPLSIWKKLSLPELTPTQMIIELADRSTTSPSGIAEDVLVKVGKFHFLADFVVVDYVVDPRVPLILGRPFLRMTRALIDVYGEELTLRVYDEAITFNVGQTLRYSYNDVVSINRIDVIDFSYKEYAQEGGDFILEEIKACLTNDSIPPGIDDDDFDPKGDLLLEKLLNDDPSSPLPPKELHVEELKIIKSSIDDPPELELKDLPSHLEYAFLEVLVGNERPRHFQPIHYASKTMTDAQAHYTTTEKELLAVVYAFEKFRPYLVLSKTIVYTDHSALKYLLAKQDAKPRLLRWILLLQEFDVIIRDKKERRISRPTTYQGLKIPTKNFLENKEITRKHFLSRLLLAIMVPPEDIMVPTTPPRKFLTLDSFGLPFTVMPMT
ncbi:reverse transcriptase domain-containing protein [Tanacetum coccineum]